MLAIMNANIQGLCPSKGKHKLAMIKEMAFLGELGIIALTESHLNSDYHEGEIAIPNYFNFRADRSQGTRGGGVIIYVHKTISTGAKLELAESHGNIEYVVLTIPACNMTLVCVYRPPAAEYNAFASALSKIHSTLIQVPGQNSLVFCGDLNFPNIKWPSTAIEGGTQSARLQAQAMLELFSDHFLLQIVEKPTRGSNILDIFAVDNEQLILNYIVQENSKISDHNLTIIKTTQSMVPDKIHTPNRPHFSI